MRALRRGSMEGVAIRQGPRDVLVDRREKQLWVPFPLAEHQRVVLGVAQFQVVALAGHHQVILEVLLLQLGGLMQGYQVLPLTVADGLLLMGNQFYVLWSIYGYVAQLQHINLLPILGRTPLHQARR